MHITSVGARKTATCLQLIDGARKHGVDVTTEMYPYTASASRIESAIYDGDWPQRTGARRADLAPQLTGTRAPSRR